jgi:hypothetical protein
MLRSELRKSAHFLAICRPLERREEMTDLEKELAHINSMSQEEMARLFRFAPAGHPYFVTDSPLSRAFDARFKGFTPAISKSIGWDKP